MNTPPLDPLALSEAPTDVIQLVQERQPVPVNDDLLDPLEYAFRHIVPIPKHYYWNVVKEEQRQEIPEGVKLWHKTIYGLQAAYQWTDSRVARPLASTLGLTSSRFDYVTLTMTEDELRASRVKAKQQSERTLAAQKQSESQLELAIFTEKAEMEEENAKETVVEFGVERS